MLGHELIFAVQIESLQHRYEELKEKKQGGGGEYGWIISYKKINLPKERTVCSNVQFQNMNHFSWLKPKPKNWLFFLKKQNNPPKNPNKTNKKIWDVFFLK